MNRSIVFVGALLILIALALANPSPTPTPTPAAERQHGTWYRPPLGATWQWQLLGEVNTSYDVDIYDIDLFNVPRSTIAELQSEGRHVICYFSAGTYEAYRDDARLFRDADLGEPLDDFPNERWLDIRSESVMQIMRQRMDVAQQKGCDGVEPDNVDGYTNDTGFDLSASDQFAFNRRIAEEAHSRGLAVGLKNDLEQVEDLADYFDFAVNEQCHEYDECFLLAPFINAGKPVFNAEYLEDYVEDPSERATLCEMSSPFSTLVLPFDLDDSFRFSCQEE